MCVAQAGNLANVSLTVAPVFVQAIDRSSLTSAGPGEVTARGDLLGG